MKALFRLIYYLSKLSRGATILVTTCPATKTLAAGRAAQRGRLRVAADAVGGGASPAKRISARHGDSDWFAGHTRAERERLDREVVPKAHDCECRLASLREHECTRVMRSRITPMKKMALSIRNHEKLILNWFKASGRLSSGVVEGFNNKAKLAMRKLYGFRSERIVQLVLYHNLLPEPQHTHRFW